MRQRASIFEPSIFVIIFILLNICGCGAAPHIWSTPNVQPRMTCESGTVKAGTFAESTIKASHVLALDDHLYVAAPCPKSDKAPPTGAMVHSKRYGIAFIDYSGESKCRLLFRFVGDRPYEGQASVTLTRKASVPRKQSGDKGYTQKVTVTGIGDAPRAGISLRADFFRTAAGRMSETLDGRFFERRFFVSKEPFMTFVSNRFRFFEGADEAKKGVAKGSVEQPMTDTADLMALFSANNDLASAMQHDRGLRLKTSEEPFSIDVEALTPISWPIHPYERMIDEVSGSYSTSSLADAAPRGMIFVQANTLNTFVGIMQSAFQAVFPLVRLMEEKPGHYPVMKRYETELALPLDRFATDGGKFVAEAAMVSSDPLFRSGTDVSILLKCKDVDGLVKVLETYRKELLSTYPSATTTLDTLGSFKVNSFLDPLGNIRQHVVVMDDLAVISNNRRALSLIVSVHRERVAPISATQDFQYMRALYPYNSAENKGFVYLGIDFLKYITSPKFRVLHARRKTAQADMRAVGYAALMFGMLEGRLPEDIHELIKSGFLDENERRLPDDSEIEFVPKTGTSNTVFGSPDRLTPIIELAVDNVTQTEADGYKAFVMDYQKEWAGFLNPIGVEMTKTQNNLTLDARMVPIMKGSAATATLEMFGEGRLTTTDVQSQMRWTSAIGKTAPIRKKLRDLGASIKWDTAFDWVGNWVMVGVGDRGTLFDLAAATGKMHCLNFIDKALSELDAPLFFAVHAADPEGAKKTLTALKTALETLLSDQVSWSAGEKIGGADTTAIKLTNIKGSNLSIHVTLIDDVLLAAFNRTVLEMAATDIASQDIEILEVDADPEGSAQMRFTIAPSSENSAAVRTLLGMFEKIGLRANQSAYVTQDILNRGLPTLSKEGPEYESRSLNYLGYIPSVIHGGTFAIEDGLVSHPIYGTMIAPVVPEIPISDSPMNVVSKLSKLQVDLSLEGKERHRTLHTIVEWAQQP